VTYGQGHSRNSNRVTSVVTLFTLRMIKTTLLSLMAFASLTIADSAKAGLGWSLSECQAHYGDSINYNPTNEYGRQKYLFQSRDYSISVWLCDDMVSGINYKRIDGGIISLNDIDTLLKVNAPKADWSENPEKDTIGSVWWYGQVSRDPFAYQAEYTEGDGVGIFTRADLEMVKAQKSLHSKDL
jgi:hypothetical protein